MALNWDELETNQDVVNLMKGLHPDTASHDQFPIISTVEYDKESSSNRTLESLNADSDITPQSNDTPESRTRTTLESWTHLLNLNFVR